MQYYLLRSKCITKFGSGRWAIRFCYEVFVTSCVSIVSSTRQPTV